MNAAHPNTDLVKAILESYNQIGLVNHLEGMNLPSKQTVASILIQLKEILFPGYFDEQPANFADLEYLIGQKTISAMVNLTEEIYKSLTWSREECKTHEQSGCKDEAEQIVQDLFAYIPDLRARLKEDMEAIFQGDPAAKSEPEVILAYPGFQAITVYRIAHFLHQKQVPLIPRQMSEIVHSETGIDIHPGATIGRGFCIDHGTGLVIGETAELGDRVKLYQGVTIGALSVAKSQGSSKRHPTIENNVTVYARTTILGGETVIGENCIIGGNLWITQSVPKNAKVYLSPDKQKIILE